MMLTSWKGTWELPWNFAVDQPKCTLLVQGLWHLGSWLELAFDHKSLLHQCPVWSFSSCQHALVAQRPASSKLFHSPTSSDCWPLFLSWQNYYNQSTWRSYKQYPSLSSCCPTMPLVFHPLVWSASTAGCAWIPIVHAASIPPRFCTSVSHSIRYRSS